MEILKLLHLMTASAFNRWALSEINPLHPDVPRLVLRQRELEDQTQTLFRGKPR